MQFLDSFKITAFKAALAAFFVACAPAAFAQTGTVTNHAFALGKGAGVTGYTSLLCTSAQLAVGQAAADPICRTLTGDVTIDAAGVTAIGASKVTNSQLATMAANTTKCNATGGVANPTDCTASTMRTNLALVPGTNVEAWDADLDAIAALAGTGIARRTGSNTWSVGTAVNLASEVAGNLPVGNLNSGTSASSSTFWRGDGTWATPAGGGGTVEQMNPGGRLTLVSGTPVMTTDQSGATTIYYAPFVGKYVPTYDGSNMALRQFTSSDSDTVGLSIALGSNWAANTIYDAFVGLDSSTVRLCTGPAWTNSGAGTSSRGSGAGTTQLALFKGLQTNAVSITCRYNNTTTFTCAANQCTYIGSFITNGSTGTIDFKFGTAASGGGAAFLSVYNAYNQTAQTAAVRDSVTTYNYTTASYRQANASTGNQVNFLVGLSGGAVTVVNSAQTFNSSGGVVAAVGIGIDSTTVNSAQIQMAAQAPASTSAVATASYVGSPAVGFHYAARLEYSQAAGTTTWDGTGGATGIQSGETFQWFN